MKQQTEKAPHRVTDETQSWIDQQLASAPALSDERLKRIATILGAKQPGA